MSSFSKASYHFAVTAFLVMTSFTWSGDAIAAQLSLTWADNSHDEAGFVIERRTEIAGTFAEIGETASGVTAYVDAAVADGTSYCYRVRAFNTAEYSDYSNMACGATAQALGLTVVKMGAGSGTVTSTPSGIICGSTCSGTFAGSTPVTLSATAAAGSTFSGWSGGGCSGAGSCTVTLTSTTTIMATFEAAQSVALTVSKSGTGNGTVSSTPAGISCGTTCSASYPSGTPVTLTATVPADSTFTGWSGGCAGSGSCTVTLLSPTTVTASFGQQSQAALLTVSVSGKGTVTSTPAGINCQKSCSAPNPGGTSVALTATPSSGFSFIGWGGGYSGKGPCTVSMTGATTVTATFKNAKAQ